MKYAVSGIAIIVTAVAMQAQDMWVQMDSVKGSPKSVCAAFVANGEGYVASGLEYSGFMRKMYSYNPAQNDWDNEQSIGGVNGGGLSRGSACAFGIYDKGYICTGQGDNTDFLKDMWEYDPTLDVWTQKADFPGSPRRGAVAFVIDGVGYVGTGEDTSGFRKDFYKYDPLNNVWGNVADFGGTARKQAVGFSMGNQGYVGTGDDGILKNDFWQYLVFQNAWVQKANFPGTSRSGATGWGIFPTGFIATGEDLNYNYTNDVWEYNYFTNQWTQRASLPASGRKHAISFVINGVAYLGTGYNGGFLDDFYAYYGVVGINETINSSNVTLFPNPAISQFTIQMNDRNASDYRLAVFSSAGIDVTSSFSVLADGSSFVVNTNGSSSGTYWYQIADENGKVQNTAGFIIR